VTWHLLKRELASEMWPTDNQFALSADKGSGRRRHPAGPRHQRLAAGALPLAAAPHRQWLDYKLMALFGRHERAGHPRAARH
jgi:hypothetical protein